MVELAKLDVILGDEVTFRYLTTSSSFSYTNRASQSYVYDYSPLGMLMTVTDPTQTITQTNTYDNRGRVVETLNATGESSSGIVKYTYDDLDRVVDKKVYDDDGITILNHESYEYIDCAEFTQGNETYLGYAEVRKTYNDDDTVKETYTTIYDKYGRLRAEKVGDTTLKTYAYDHLNRLISEQGDGLNLSYTYAWNNEVETTTRTIGTDTYTEKNIYNGLGQLTAYRDYDGYAEDYDTVIYEYDYLGNVSKQQTAFDIQDDTVLYAETLNTYDANGNVTKTQVKNSAPTAAASYVETTYAYDNLNRPVTATSGNIVTTYTYDDLGNITTQKTGDSETEYSYNTLGQLIKKTDALEQDETYTYDKNGFLKTKTDRNGTIFTYTYNALGNVLTENAIGTDLSTNARTSTYFKTGELKSITENGVTLQYEYDTKGLLTKVTDVAAGAVQNYTYDDFGKLTAYTLNLNGTQQINTAYGYDAAARLYTVTEDGVTQAIYAYNPDDNIQSETIGNGITTSYNYNTANLVTNVSSQKDETLLARYTYAYSMDGNISAKTDNAGITTSYVYDNAGMLSSETVSSPYEQIQHTQYAYDNRGNRTSATGNSGNEYTESYTYDLNNRLTKVTKVVYNEYEHPNNIFSTRYNYDANGNLFSENTSAIGKSLDDPALNVNVFGTGNVGWNTKTGVTIYSFNLNNQLTGVEKDGKSATYTYNPDGYRISKTVDGVTTNHIWSGTQIIAETNSDDTIKATYIYGNRRIYNEQDSVKTYYLYDAHGDTKQLTDSLGVLTYDYTYDAFGNEVESGYGLTAATTTTEPYNPFRYCGEYFDEETGFIYLRARYYDSEIGRFVSEDPICDGLNWYAYCNNNPIVFIDSSGLYYIAEDVVSWTPFDKNFGKRTGTYTLHADNNFTAISRNIAGIPFVGSLLSGLVEKNMGVVGGNSANDFGSILQSFSLETIADSGVKYAGELADNASKILAIKDAIESYGIVYLDDIAFKLLKKNNIPLTSTSIEKLENTMNKSYEIILSNRDYFYFEYYGLGTLFEIDNKIANSESPRRTISAMVDRYKYKLQRAWYDYFWTTGIGLEEYVELFRTFLWDYSDRLDVIDQMFVDNFR